MFAYLGDISAITLSVGSLREGDHCGDPDVDGRIILKWINKYRDQLDAANDLLVVNQFSTCFGRVYAHLQEFELLYAAFGFQSCYICCVQEPGGEMCAL
jgi:hypothetical protein